MDRASKADHLDDGPVAAYGYVMLGALLVVRWRSGPSGRRSPTPPASSAPP